MSTAGLLLRLGDPPSVSHLWSIKEDIPDTHRTVDVSMMSSRSSISSSPMPPVTIQDISVTRSNLATSLFQAVFNCRASKVKFLLGKGHVSANITNDQGHNLLMTALYISDDRRRDSVFRYLLRHGVDCCYRHQKTGRDVLALACSLGRVDQVRSILEAGMGEIDVVRTDADGLTPLHLAVQEGHVEVVRMLVGIMDKYRLSVDVADNYGLTPYMYARRLGRLDIARILVEEGNASIHRRDNLTFRSADDWAVIGAKENVTRQKKELQRQVAYYRIRGMLPPINELREMKHQPPRIILNDDNDLDEGSGDKPNSAPTPDGSQSSSEEGTDSTLKAPNGSTKGLYITSDKFIKPSPRGRRVSSLMALNNQIRQISSPKNSMLSKSVDTAFTLLGIKAEDTMEHATTFVQSELDTSKVKEFSAGPQGLTAMDQLTDMMQALSDQQSSSFRKVALPPLTPPKVIVKEKKKKKKVSTLAILMAKERRQRAYRGSRSGHHKTPMPISGSKPTKTLVDHAKEKKRSKNSPDKIKEFQDHLRQASKRKAPGADD